MSDSHIYLIREGKKRQKNYFKIGMSSFHSNKKNGSRLSSLQTGNPRELFLIKKIENNHNDKLETYFHQNLQNYHYRGEWFYLNQDILFNECDTIIQQFNSLSDLDIDNMKGRIGAFAKDVCPKTANKKSLIKRLAMTHEWAEQIELRNEIIQSVKMLKIPNLRNVAQVLNGRKILSRKGLPWSHGTLSAQLKVLGWNWDELKKIK
jgi:hypothetical protein